MDCVSQLNYNHKGSGKVNTEEEEEEVEDDAKNRLESYIFIL